MDQLSNKQEITKRKIQQHFQFKVPGKEQTISTYLYVGDIKKESRQNILSLYSQ